jgi:hypothetical protein
MARKNSLREVKGLKGSKNQEVFAYSDYWEVWEQIGEDDSDPDSWQFLADGLLQDCIEAVSPTISMQLDMELMRERSQQPQHTDFLEELLQRVQQRQAEIRKECLTKGEYKKDGWHMRSQHTREQCEYMAQNGYPVINQVEGS